MRARNIKPGFFTNEKLAECSPMARLLFIGLPMLCDRDGRMEFRPLRIKAELFPYESCTVQDWCDELLKFGDDFISIYCVNSTRYLQVTNFAKHQHCHINEPSRNLPCRPALMESTVQAPCENGTSTVQKRLNAECGMLNAESSIPQGGETPKASKPPVEKKSKNEPTEAFLRFWDAWPKHQRKTDKAGAWAKWKSKGCEQIADQVIASIAAWTSSMEWCDQNGKFIPEPKKWLYNSQWLGADAIIPASSRPTREQLREAAIDKIFDEANEEPK